MAALTSILIGLGIATSIAGTAMSYMGAQKQASAQKKMLQAQMEAERQRKQQMNLDAMRKKRETVRQAQLARAQALQVASAQGADQSSGLQGAYAGIAGESGNSQLAVNQNQIIGNNIFAANERYGVAAGQYADAGGMMATGGGLSSLGGALMKNSGTIGRLGSYYTGGLV